MFLYCDNVIHRKVEWFGWYFGYDLELETYPKTVGIRMFYEETVVITFASA